MDSRETSIEVLTSRIPRNTKFHLLARGNVLQFLRVLEVPAAALDFSTHP